MTRQGFQGVVFGVFLLLGAMPAVAQPCSDDFACGDDNLCTTDYCGADYQCHFDPIVCNDGNACTADVCDPGSGSCISSPMSCDDGNACTVDSCNPSTGCVSTPLSCDDHDPCTADSCSPTTGCVNTPQLCGCTQDSDCNDSDACTSDACIGGQCTHSQLACVGGQSCAPPIIMTKVGNASLLACTPNPNGQPTLNLVGSPSLTLECGRDIWSDPGAQAFDSACNPLEVHRYNLGNDPYGPGPNTCAEGTYGTQYIAWDAQGHTVSAVRYVQVDDTTPPTLTLKGPSHMTLQCNHGYVEPGWDAYDDCYGNITPEVHTSGYPNAWVTGTYTVTYTLTDSGGNSAPPLTRTVDVHCP